MRSAWQQAGVARKFLEETRGAIPLGAAQLDLMLDIIGFFHSEPRLVLDLGCGDGALARSILQEYPAVHVVMIDHSAPMLEHARDVMAPWRDRCTIIERDLMDPLSEVVQPGTVDVVVSGFAIHHLPSERKRPLYSEVFQTLRMDGLFVNMEHVSSPTRELEQLWDQLFITHMAQHSSKPGEQVEAEYQSRTDRAENILEPVEMQLEWLRAIGFSQVDCYFKWLELAMFGGVRR